MQISYPLKDNNLTQGELGDEIKRDITMLSTTFKLAVVTNSRLQTMKSDIYILRSI
jgi:hypothetical protein